MTTFSVYGKVAMISGQLMLNWMTFLRYMHAVMYQHCDIGWIPILVQLESCMLGDEHGLSKDLDVMFWIAHREHHGKPQLRDTTDFVIISEVLHREFDLFKESTMKKGCSFVAVNELLSFYCSQSSRKFSTIHKFGYSYVELSAARIDSLIDWMLEMRNKYKQEGRAIFLIGAESLLSATKG